MDNDTYSKLIDERGIHYAIKEILYKSYVQVWGEDVRKIIANVNEAIKRLEDVSNKGEEASISEMTAAISLALNVQHVAGTIMVDLIPDDYIISNVNTDFLDNLSKLDVSNWEKEFHEEFGV
jgi:rRNA maturation endonuclease Nob1